MKASLYGCRCIIKCRVMYCNALSCSSYVRRACVRACLRACGRAGVFLVQWCVCVYIYIYIHIYIYTYTYIYIYVYVCVCVSLSLCVCVCVCVCACLSGWMDVFMPEFRFEFVDVCIYVYVRRTSDVCISYLYTVYIALNIALSSRFYIP